MTSTSPASTVSSGLMPVAVDVMGGDLGSKVVVEGAIAAATELQISSVLVGLKEEIEPVLAELPPEISKFISIHHASQVITMEDSPSAVLRAKPDASIRVAFQLLKDGKASAVVSPGNTGAMMAAGIAVCGVLAGVVRPAIASFIPRPGLLKPTVLLDSGANVDCHAEQLVQFALMGSYYAISALGTERPRVALLSNGSEASKGTDTIRAAAKMLAELPQLNFVGYVEGRDLSSDVADVVVCDGFVGNIVLKTVEGSAELVFDSIRHQVQHDRLGKLGMWLARPMFKALLKAKLDPSSYGGAPLLGLAKIGVVCHGSSSAVAIKNAIRAASKFSSEQLIERISEALSQLESGNVPGLEDGVWSRMGQRFERRKKKNENREARTEPETE